MTQLACSFCKKPKEAVALLVAGPNDAYICDHCIEVSAAVVMGTRGQKRIVSWPLEADALRSVVREVLAEANASVAT